MEIKAYKCDHCGSINEKKVDYNSCKRRCGKLKQEQLKAEALRNNFNTLADSIRLSLTNIRDLPKAIEAFLLEHYHRAVEINITGLRFGSVPNSHHCPIGGITNWGGQTNDSKPRSYPGWSGTISGKGNLYTKKLLHPITNRELHFSDILRNSTGALIRGVHTGTGGGGDKFSYELEIFLDDFPKIKEKHNAYLDLRLKSTLRVERAMEIEREATKKLMDDDPKLKGFVQFNQILKTLSASNGNNMKKRVEEIRQSGEWYDALKVPKEFDFDQETYRELSSQFGV
jgi:hypothetical protein